ncbi:hypothetical protein TRFO_29813 [Tritrichomonas foetus]|uniref:Fucosyltransferase n=1 Tax=Tritrichomonas foetus TaxID=1144522 RepID=A0A1J4JW48_9EUKA|nr:hypothetical protein TRFO_29813 [Tritrichomonas foetus]|eukprot:OHT02938.1 hypothetical protein TRFO_29813 [Tritrichomonas foetus]
MFYEFILIISAIFYACHSQYLAYTMGNCKHLWITLYSNTINEEKDLNFILYKNTYVQMHEMWDELLKLDSKKIRKALTMIYPFNQLRQRSIIMNPLISSDEKDNYSSKSIFKTNEVHDIIYENQYPRNCSNRSLLLIPDCVSGIGSMIHVFTTYLALAVEKNLTLVWDPQVNYAWPSGDFCNGKMIFDCYFRNISKCNVNDVQRAQIIEPGVDTPRGLVPSIVRDILNSSMISPEHYYFYWRIMATSYIVRFNKEMEALLDDLRSQYIRNPLDEYDISLYIRHGDKENEMPLVKTEKYAIPIEMLQKALGKKLSVLVNSEDPSSIEWFVQNQNLFKSVSFFDYPRNNGGVDVHIQEPFQISTRAFADLRETFHSNILIGTFGSNWNRLIFELHQTQHIDLPYPYFEVGCGSCVSPMHCHLRNESFDLNW